MDTETGVGVSQDYTHSTLRGIMLKIQSDLSPLDISLQTSSLIQFLISLKPHSLIMITQSTELWFIQR